MPHAPAIREPNLATICCVRRLKITYSPGERACSSWILASAVCKSRTTSIHSKFKPFVFFRMSKGGSMVAPLCNTSSTSLHERENRRAFNPRVIRLIGIFCRPRVLGANVRCELLVALLFVVPLHFVNGCADERPGRFKRPCAFAANPALEILSFDPIQLAPRRRHATPPGWCANYRLLEHTSRSKRPQGLNLSDRKRLLSVGHPTLAENCYLNPRSSSKCRITS